MDIIPVKRAEPAQAAFNFYEAMPAVSAMPAMADLTDPDETEADPSIPAPAVMERPTTPATTDEPSAGYLSALRTEGAVAAFIVAGATGLVGSLAVAGFDVLGVGPWSLIDAALFFLLGFGIIHRIRFAAVAAFILFIAETVVFYAVSDINLQTIGVISVIIRALLIRSFYRGMRGVLAPRRMSRFYGFTAAAVAIGFIAGFALSSIR